MRSNKPSKSHRAIQQTTEDYFLKHRTGEAKAMALFPPITLPALIVKSFNKPKGRARK